MFCHVGFFISPGRARARHRRETNGLPNRTATSEGPIHESGLLRAKALQAAGHHEFSDDRKGLAMTLGTILLVVLILFLLGAFPRWEHSRNWGYGPSGGIGLVLVIVLILVLVGRI